MKKLLLLGTVFALFTAAASAQQSKNDFRADRGTHQRFDNGNLTRGEKAKLYHDGRQMDRTKKSFRHDGKLSRSEKKRLAKMKRHHRHDAYRYRHNDRRRS